MLSILIPSIPERAERLNRLIKELENQIDFCSKVHDSLGKVTLIVDDSKRFLQGGLSIGDKRNSLLNRSESEYVCFLDDDDWVSPDYVETLLRLCNQGKDVCTFKSLFKCDDYWTIIDMGLNNPNEGATPEKEVKRNAWHICPIKRTIAVEVEFSSLNHNEDWEWMNRVLKSITTEAKTNRILHNYNHYKVDSEADKILNENTIN
jgi:glycosyltransferase involved in cell wall biosynthesis